MNIAEIRAVTEKATPGEWGITACKETPDDVRICHLQGKQCICCLALMGADDEAEKEQWIPDAEFIARSRDWVPALCDEAERLQKIVDDYAAAARVISLHLRQFCNPALPYIQMIAEASRRADKRIVELEKENARLKSKLNEDIHEENKILYKADLAQQNRIHDLQVERVMLKKALEMACNDVESEEQPDDSGIDLFAYYIQRAKEEMGK